MMDMIWTDEISKVVKESVTRNRPNKLIMSRNKVLSNENLKVCHFFRTCVMSH